MALWLSGLSYYFGAVGAVRDVDLSVAEGARHGIIGPNGAGKTTLFNLLTGELRPTSGSITLFGTDVTHTPQPRRVALGLGRTYQITRTFGALTVLENLTLATLGLSPHKFALFRRWTGYRGNREMLEQVAERFQLSHRLQRRAADLSHGEQRQLDVALAVTLRPRVLLLDEPGAGLSPGERLTMTRLIQELPADLTVVMIEHDMDMVRDVVSRVTVLHLGRVVADGPTSRIRQDERVRALYLGRRVTDA
ncbi:MAG TPA: ABC transporter ATP-binding protein [bacterium]|nr:ABC transporter ATP-binding protein [bacterium]